MSAGAARAAQPLELDHLVVACPTLAEGRAWCEAMFGVTPAPGGQHALMGTHNLLLAISSPRFPRSYLELIAIDAEAPAPARARWFDLDRPPMQALIASGPRLVHWVARAADLDVACAGLRRAGFDPGPAVDAERMTARGLLRWRIALTEGGQRHADGAVPLLIAWGDVHPAESLPESGVELRSLRLGGVEPSLAAWLGADAAAPSSPALVAGLVAPVGAVTLAGA